MAGNPFVTPLPANPRNRKKVGAPMPFEDYLRGQQQGSGKSNPYVAAPRNAAAPQGGGGKNKGGGGGGGNQNPGKGKNPGGGGGGTGGGGSNGNGGGGGSNNNGKNGTWTPNASYSAYGSDYYEQGNKYGNNMEIAGSASAPEKPDMEKPQLSSKLDNMKRKDMSKNQKQKVNQYQQDMNQYNREMDQYDKQTKDYNNTDAFYSNQNPYEYFNKLMAKAGYTPGASTGFENWLKNEFGQIQAGYDMANQANNQLNFNDYLATFGSPDNFANFLLTRYQSRTPGEQGLGSGAAYGGPARWSVF